MNATCPECGKPVGPNALQGLCPECMMKIGLGSEVPSVASGGAAGPTKGKPFVPPTPAELAPGFPQLEILGLIGQGGMGAVYKARQKELDRVVALKILPPGIGQDPSFAERFTREARALAKLNHPGVVTLYEFGKTDRLFFFLMEFVDGVSLRRLLEVGRLSSREALAIVPQICDALQYAHDQGIVHRDIKPENILLDRQGRVKVADFGLAKIVAGGDALPRPPTEGKQKAAAVVPAALTAAGKVMGTPQYMAPEQREHPTEVDHRADIYSLGVVLYQMLTGELPGKPIEPPSKKVQLDVRLDEVVLHALEKEPERRYQQVSQVRADVETLVITPPAAGQRMSRVKRFLWISSAVTVAILLTLAVTSVVIVLQNPAGQIGWWRLDQRSGTTVKDSSHLFGHSGRILHQGFRWVEGRRGHALQLDGGQHILIGKIYQGSYDQLSLACWIRKPSSGWESIVERGNWDNPDGIGLWADYSGKAAAFGHYLSGVVRSRTTVQDNQWHHIVGTMAKSPDGYLYSIYVDGNLDGAITNAVGLASSTNPWTIGGRYNGTWRYSGLVSDVRIFNRALSPSEVRRIYNK